MWCSQEFFPCDVVNDGNLHGWNGFGFSLCTCCSRLELPSRLVRPCLLYSRHEALTFPPLLLVIYHNPSTTPRHCTFYLADSPSSLRLAFSTLTPARFRARTDDDVSTIHDRVETTPTPIILPHPHPPPSLHSNPRIRHGLGLSILVTETPCTPRSTVNDPIYRRTRRCS